MSKKIIVGIMGGAEAGVRDLQTAEHIGRLVAERGWILLNGGRSTGVMEASARGAKEKGGLTVGILPHKTLAGVSEHIDIPILTGMGDARNYINVLSSDVVIACFGGAGTVSEIAIALKNEKPVIVVNFDLGSVFDAYEDRGLLYRAASAEEAMEKAVQVIREAQLL